MVLERDQQRHAVEQGGVVKRILIIGIGAGNPDYITVQAIDALNCVDVFFLLDKGAAKEKLNALRREICERFIKHGNYRFVDATSPEKAEVPNDYRASIDDLNAEKRDLFERLIARELEDGMCGAFLVWGDPSLYDSTVRIVGAIAKSGRHALEYDVIPGISSVQALAARHKVTLNQIGEAMEITTGRRLAEGFPNNVGSVVVMLDAEKAVRVLQEEDLDVYWGAYIGTPDEILVSGKLSEVVDEIDRLRKEARARNGWVMDTYLLRKPNAAAS
jgi:precorrin-6A synthase